MTARPHSNVATGINSADLAAHNLDPTANQAALNAQPLNGHSDTNLGAIADKQVAIWDAGTGKFIPINYRLASLDDVNLAGLADGNFLAYDLASTKWVPVAAPSADVGGRYGVHYETVGHGLTKTLRAGVDAMYQMIEPGGTYCTVQLLPDGAVAGDRFIIKNVAGFTLANRVQVMPTVDYVYSGSVREYIFDGADWVYAENGSSDNASFKFNTAYGNRAAGYNYGCAYGYQSDGSSNGTAIGFQASASLYGVAVGRRTRATRYSVAIGNEALWSMSSSTDSRNIAVGYRAGDNLTTGLNCILIGHDIDNLTATTNGYMSLANTIFALAPGGTFATGTTVSTAKVGILDQAPASALSVAGGIQCADDADAASADKVGTMRYRTSGATPNKYSYCEMCMEGTGGDGTYAWEVIKQIGPF
jgi:hypothetical protein